MTKYSKSLRDKVFQLYATGEPIERITKKIGVSKTTIYKWKYKYEWSERKRNIETKVQTELDETVTQIKKQQVQLVKGIIADYIKELKAGKVKTKTSEIIPVMKHWLHLMGESETSIREDSTEKLMDKMTEWFG